MNNFRSEGEPISLRSRMLCLVFLAGAFAAGQAGTACRAAEPQPCSIRFNEVTEATGVAFRHTDGSTGKRYIVETVTAGLALFDFDDDGYIDLYFLNGAPTPGYRVEQPPRNALYRNNGDWTFTDLTQEAGVGDLGFGLGVAVADYDNDGFPDIYVNNFGPNVLYRNNGDGTFTDVTTRADVACGNLVGAGACFLDIDGDGDVDLYCANYVRFRYEDDPLKPLLVAGFPQYRSPKEYQPEPDVLIRNNGDGTFTDVSAAAGIFAHAGTGMGIVCLDYDNDADTDVAVLNDVRGNYLFENDGTGRFREMGLVSGFGYNADGMALGSMGIDCGDFDNDGWLDLYQTAYATELPVLFRNAGGGFFEDVTRTTEAGIRTYPHVNWGVGFGDLDNDGDRDIFIGNGHLQDNVELYSGTTAFAVRNTVLMNVEGQRFIDVSDQCGNGLLPERSSRGVGLDDLTNDGLIDVVILNSRTGPTILRNDTHNDHRWLQVRLRGVRSNRDGVGAHVRVTAGGRTQLAEVHSGRGYQSHFGTRLHFGLGTADRVERIEIRWIGGGVDLIENVEANQKLVITEASMKAAGG